MRAGRRTIRTVGELIHQTLYGELTGQQLADNIDVECIGKDWKPWLYGAEMGAEACGNKVLTERIRGICGYVSSVVERKEIDCGV